VKYANEPVAASEFRTDQLAVSAKRFTQCGDLELEVVFRHNTALPHPVEKLPLCDERAISLH
jgi:hypothetical protein